MLCVPGWAMAGMAARGSLEGGSTLARPQTTCLRSLKSSSKTAATGCWVLRPSGASRRRRYAPRKFISNFVGIPTDCPQRDERLGWMGDAQVFWDAAGFNMDVAAFTRRFMGDVGDGQSTEGAFAEFNPQ